MWRPTNHKPEAIARFKARRAEAGIGGIVVHALYLVNLATTNDEIYDKSVTDAAYDGRCGVGDRSRRGHLPRRLASRRRLRGRARAHLLGAGADSRALRRRHLALPRELGRGPAGRSGGRSRSSRRSSPGSATIRASACASTRAISTRRATTSPSRRRSMRSSRSSTREIGLDRLRALHINDSAMPLGSNRDRHANIGEGLMGEGLGAFLAQPGVPAPERLPRGGGRRRPRPRRRRPASGARPAPARAREAAAACAGEKGVRHPWCLTPLLTLRSTAV